LPCWTHWTESRVGRGQCGSGHLTETGVVRLRYRGELSPEAYSPDDVLHLNGKMFPTKWEGRGFGNGLFGDASRRLTTPLMRIGIRAIVVQAISAEAKKFYLALGFDASPREPVMLARADAPCRFAGQLFWKAPARGGWGFAMKTSLSPPKAMAKSPPRCLLPIPRSGTNL
jgi:hypothetical protein